MGTIAVVSCQVDSSYQAVPLGAASVVSALKADPDIASRADVRLLDYALDEARFSGLDANAIGSVIAREIASLPDRPLLVGFSVYVWNRAVLEAAATFLANAVAGVVLFAGGPEITALPASVAESPFGTLVRGEGEGPSRVIARQWLSLEDTPKSAGQPSVPVSADQPSSSRSSSLSSLPSPWLDGSLDDCRAVSVHKGALWELARGCPYSCSYCYESKGERKVRYMPMARLEAELRRFTEIGIERVFVLDPTYNTSRERALEILALLEREAPSIHVNFEARAELVDRELARAFSRIPCSVQIGLQSSNPKALECVDRPSDMKAFARKISLLNDEGVIFGLDLMYGLPHDSLSLFRASLDFALSLYPNNLEIFRLAVLPGTRLFDEAASLSLSFDSAPPYHVRATPTFGAADLEKAAALARAADVFYTQGRAVSWFLAVLHPLKLKSSQFLSDFARFLEIECPAVLTAREASLSHAEAERLQLAFIERKYAEKGLSWAFPAVRDLVALHGAWTRAFAEEEASALSLSYDPEDLMGGDAMDIASFAENAYMESFEVRVVPGPEGPEILATEK